MIKKIEPYKNIALIYDEIRPSYPEKLIEDIIKLTNLKHDDKILEIGAGTGKATVQFAEKGYKIHAIEVGQDMGKILKDNCAKYDDKVSLEIASFEEWVPKDNVKYDVIYCAQAFHWLDKAIKYKKCSELLKDEGYLVLFWYNASGEKTEQSKIINEKVNKIIGKYVENYFVKNDKEERNEHSGVYQEDERKAEIEESQLFEIIKKIEYKGEVRENADKYIKAQKSVPAFASILDGLSDNIINNMEKEIKDTIIKNGGYVGTLFDYSLYIAKKIG